MKSFVTKALPVKSARLATTSLRPMSEVLIQHELDVAVLNAQKNRSIKDHATRSPSKKTDLKSASNIQEAQLHILSREYSVTFSDSPKSTTKLQESSVNNQKHPLISKQGVAAEGISSLQTQLQNMIGEWSCAIKHAIFHEEMELNEDTRHSSQLLKLN